jgi:spore maturation protein CgeB
VRAINSGKIYLSFSATRAGQMNVKVGVFEAAACGACILTERFPEMEAYFEHGKEILGYSTFEEALELTRRHLADEGLRRAVAERCYRRFLAEHTWGRRWRKVLADVEEARGG